MGSRFVQRNERHAAWERSWGPRPPQEIWNENCRIFIEIVDLSLEKCVFGAHRNVLHYVLRRKRVTFRNNDHFELEICVKARGGRAARCMGSVPVADLLASEARHDRARVHVRCAYGDPTLCLFPGDGSRESCGRVNNSLKLCFAKRTAYLI